MLRRRMVTAMLAAAVMLGTTGVAAEELTNTADEIVLKEIVTYEDADWVYGSPDILYTRDGDSSALMTIDGTMLTEFVYADWEFYYEHGYIAAQLMDNPVSGNGVLAVDGSTVIPFEYGMIDILSPEWAVAYTWMEGGTEDNYDGVIYGDTDMYYLNERADIYYLPDSRCTGSFAAEELIDVAVAGYSINIETSDVITTYDAEFNVLSTDAMYVWDTDYAQNLYLSVYEGDKYGLADGDGNVVINAEYDYIYAPQHGYAEAVVNEKTGLVRLDGTVVVPFEYDSILYSYYLPYDARYEGYGYDAQGYFAVVKDGKLGYVNENGEVTCELAYAESALDNYGASAAFEDLKGNTMILAADGVETVVEGYQSVGGADFGSGMLYIVYDEDYNDGLIDWHGNVILPCEYYDISLSGDGQYARAVSGEDYSSTIYEVVYPNETEEPAGTEATAITPLPAPVASVYSGTWYLFSVTEGEETVEASELGETIVMELNPEGTALFMDENFLWGIKNNDLVIGEGTDEDAVMTFNQDGTLVVTEPGYSMLFVREKPELGFVGTTYVCTAANAGSVGLDVESLGLYDVVFYADGTCTMTMGGVAMEAASWVEEENSILVDYFGQKFVFDKTETGFEMNYYGAMLLTYEPQA